MIGLLRAILVVVNELFGQEVETTQAIHDLRVDIDSTFTAQAAAIEHLRALIEGDSIPIQVGTPTFTPTGGPE